MNNSWATRGNSCFFSTYNYHIITHEFIINLFYHYFASVVHVDSLGRGFAIELAAVEGEPFASLIANRQLSIVN